MSDLFDIRHASPRWARGLVPAGLALILTLSAAGCGSGSGFEVVPLKDQIVTGKVTLAGGKPLTKGRVALFPLQEPFMPLYGTLKPDGSYTLGAAGIGTNVSHGEFLVTIEPPGFLPGSRPKGISFPAKYVDQATSGLKATITPETKELPTIELK